MMLIGQQGREHMVRNEIAVLKRVSAGHKNIVQLHDFFETTHNLYVSRRRLLKIDWLNIVAACL